jgi:FlaG/FlaF family flagellin (archaellin)
MGFQGRGTGEASPNQAISSEVAIIGLTAITVALAVLVYVFAITFL